MIRILLPSMSEMPGCKQLRFFKKMLQVPAKSMAEEDIAIGDFLHIQNTKFHGLQNFRNVVRMIEI